jgi:organic hydroperoxide reductase OsmC/OhrA
LSTAEATPIVEATHANICPYSHATRGNIDIAFTIVGND